MIVALVLLYKARRCTLERILEAGRNRGSCADPVVRAGDAGICSGSDLRAAVKDVVRGKYACFRSRETEKENPGISGDERVIHQKQGSVVLSLDILPEVNKFAVIACATGPADDDVSNQDRIAMGSVRLLRIYYGNL